MDVELEEVSIGVGIDIGHTVLKSGIYNNSCFEIIRNDNGNDMTPNCVLVTDDGCFVGHNAKDKTNSISGLKRVVGRNSLVKKGKYATIEFDEEGAIIANVGDQRRSFFSVHLLSTVIRSVKNGVQRYLRENSVKAVITVPACFSYTQRRALADCCILEEVQIIGILTDPIAAVMACELHKKMDECLVVIFSLGGGTLEVTVMSARGGNLKVKSTSGDTQVGGEEFDTRLVRYFVQEFTWKYGKDPSKDKNALRRLRSACERAKRQLSSKYEVKVTIDRFFDDIDFSVTISRALFAELCRDLFFAVEKHTENALRRAGVHPKDIDHVILVGGGTHIPKIHQFLGEYFGEDKFFPNINPEEVIVRGAAMQAELLAKNLMNVTPLSISVGDSGYGTIVLIPRGTPLPTTKNIILAIYGNKITTYEAALRIYEGEHSLSLLNNLLGVLTLKEITPDGSGVPRIDITIEIDSFGTLVATVRDLNSGNFNCVCTPTSKGCLTTIEVENIVKFADENRKADDCELKRLEARKTMERCINEIRVWCFVPIIRDWYIHSVRKEKRWLKYNLNAGKVIYDYKVTELQSTFSHILQNKL